MLGAGASGETSGSSQQDHTCAETLREPEQGWRLMHSEGSGHPWGDNEGNWEGAVGRTWPQRDGDCPERVSGAGGPRSISGNALRAPAGAQGQNDPAYPLPLPGPGQQPPLCPWGGSANWCSPACPQPATSDSQEVGPGLGEIA